MAKGYFETADGGEAPRRIQTSPKKIGFSHKTSLEIGKKQVYWTVASLRNHNS